MLIKILVLILAMVVFVVKHEQAHKEIYQLAGAEPVFYYRFPLYFDYIPTQPAKTLTNVQVMQAWVEIIGYHLFAFLIGLFCILWVVFK